MPALHPPASRASSPALSADAPHPDSAPSAQALRWLLRVALPDKGRHKAQGWWGQVDFVVTRSHVDADGDAFHDGLFITDWKRHDFWLSLPGSAPAQARRGLALGWWRQLHPAARSADDGDALLCQWRSYDAMGASQDWRDLDLQDAGPQARRALAPAWGTVLRYWRAAERERRAGRPARARLHAALSQGSVAALARLPLFVQHFNDWSDPERAGCWLEDVWIGARQAGWHAGARRGAALKLSWRNGQERAGDAEDDAHACYQIDLLEPSAVPPPGTAHPPGLALSYSQRQSDARVPLPADAALHLRHLAVLLRRVERLLEHQQRQPHADVDLAALPPDPALGLHPPPHALQASDQELFGAAAMALSRDWQAATRGWAAAWRAQCERAGEADGGAALLALHDARTPRQSAAVLRLARQVHALGDAGLSERFRRRFAFAPSLYAPHAARHGRRVQALQWLDDGALLCWLDEAEAAGACWRIAACGLRVAPAAAPTPRAARLLELQGLALRIDAAGDVTGCGADGVPLWRHHLGAAASCLAQSPADSALLAAGTVDGAVVLLQRRSAPDALLTATSRYHEVRRVLFWRDAPVPFAW